MFSIEHGVGRLVEITIWSPVAAEEAAPWAALHDRVVAGVGGPYLCLVDLSRATVFPPDAVDAYLATMRNEPQLLRTATLLGKSPTLHLQIARMIREVNHPQRRAFRDAYSGREESPECAASPADLCHLRSPDVPGSSASRFAGSPCFGTGAREREREGSAKAHRALDTASGSGRGGTRASARGAGSSPSS
jgi:hypothetical protein